MRPDPYKQKISRRYKAAHNMLNKPKTDRPDQPDDNNKNPSNTQTHAPSKSTFPSARGKFSRRKLVSNSWRYEDTEIPISDGGDGDNKEKNEEEEEEGDAEANAHAFVDYLKNKSEDLAADTSAVYFKLKSETESAEFLARNKETWDSLLHVPIESLYSVSELLPPRDILAVDEALPLPDSVLPPAACPDKEEAGSAAKPAVQRRQGLPSLVGKQKLVPKNADLVAGFSAKNAPRPDIRPAGTGPANDSMKSTTLKPLVSTGGAARLPNIPKPRCAKQEPADELEAFLDDLI